MHRFNTEKKKKKKKNNTFFFNGQYYRRIKGIAIGTRFVPVYATMVIRYLKETLYDSFKGQFENE